MKNYIKKYRKKKKMKQTELGIKLNKTQQAISKYERGETKISLEEAFKICSILEQPIEKVFPSIKK